MWSLVVDVAYPHEFANKYIYVNIALKTCQLLDQNELVNQNILLEQKYKTAFQAELFIATDPLWGPASHSHCHPVKNGNVFSHQC